MYCETAANLSGARFVVLKGGLARLERALGQFFLDVHTGEDGYTEVNPPLLVSDHTMFGTAQLPKFADDQFPTSRSEQGWRAEFDRFLDAGLRGPVFDELKKVEAATSIEQLREQIASVMNAQLPALREKFDSEHDERQKLWLIPTAEVPLTTLVRESIVDPDKLPMRLTACTPCFRAEAGAAGKDTRGMIRQHQFTKVELVSITTPERSKSEHERMLNCAEEILKKLDLHYRVVTLCTGD